MRLRILPLVCMLLCCITSAADAASCDEGFIDVAECTPYEQGIRGHDCCHASNLCCSSNRGLMDRILSGGCCHHHGHGGHNHSRADHRAPAGIHGDHLHKPGDWMLEYKYMNMAMDGARRGTQRLSPQEVTSLGGFPVVPMKMNMEMHMLHLMWGWTDNVTLYAVGMASSNSMSHIRTGDSLRFNTHISGFDDTTVGFLWKGWEGCCNDQLIFDLGISIPSGNLNRRAQTTPLPNPPEFPYPMRLSSGTVDLRPAVTYTRAFQCGSIGAQCKANLPLGENREGYRVGNEYRATAWRAWLLRENLSVSFRVEGLWVENYSGADSDLNQGLVFTNRPDMRQGTYLNLGYGLNWVVCGGNRLAFELTHPIYQDLEGFQLETDFTLYASWSKAF